MIIKWNICVVYVGDVWPLMLFNWIRHTKSESDLSLSSSPANSQRLLCSQKAGIKCSY